jgi:hypothetical protein
MKPAVPGTQRARSFRRQLGFTSQGDHISTFEHQMAGRHGSEVTLSSSVLGQGFRKHGPIGVGTPLPVKILLIWLIVGSLAGWLAGVIVEGEAWRHPAPSNVRMQRLSRMG